MPAASTSMPSQRAARIIGAVMLLTFVTSIGGYAAYGSILDDPNWVTDAGSVTAVQIGAALEILLVITNIASAIVLFPILRRTHERLALGWVASRIVESTMIAVGVVSLLAVLTLNADGVGPDASLVSSAQGFVAAHDATFLLGPGFCVAFGNGLLLGYAMLRSGLLPRRLAMIGLAGGSLCLVNATGALFGAWEQMSSIGGLLSLPEMIWEGGVLGIYLITKGFITPQTSPQATGQDSRPARPVAIAAH
jgi:hypothetical protein